MHNFNTFVQDNAWHVFIYSKSGKFQKYTPSATARFHGINPYGMFFNVSFLQHEIACVRPHAARSQTPPQVYDILFCLFIAPGTN